MSTGQEQTTMKTAAVCILTTALLLWHAPLRAEVPPAAARRAQQRQRIDAHSARVEARQQQARARLAEHSAAMERRREKARQRLSAPTDQKTR
jgi:hypothetical protein